MVYRIIKALVMVLVSLLVFILFIKLLSMAVFYYFYYSMIISSYISYLQLAVACFIAVAVFYTILGIKHVRTALK